MQRLMKNKLNLVLVLKQPTGVASVATDLLVLGCWGWCFKVSESAGTGSPIF
jgi:hypothetical protein